MPMCITLSKVKNYVYFTPASGPERQIFVKIQLFFEKQRTNFHSKAGLDVTFNKTLK